MRMRSPARRRFFRTTGALLATASLAGCGFQLRGARPLAFSTIHVGVGAQTDLGAALRRRLAANGTSVAEDAANADVRLEFLRDSQDREILTLTGAGKVREYQLKRLMTFRLVDRGGKDWISPTTISARREYNYDDSQVLAKEQEEALLFRDMQTDLVEQLMRRLAAAKP
jgi:LPS-assembly lipoprotein